MRDAPRSDFGDPLIFPLLSEMSQQILNGLQMSPDGT